MMKIPKCERFFSRNYEYDISSENYEYDISSENYEYDISSDIKVSYN